MRAWGWVTLAILAAVAGVLAFILIGWPKGIFGIRGQGYDRLADTLARAQKEAAARAAAIRRSRELAKKAAAEAAAREREAARQAEAERVAQLKSDPAARDALWTEILGGPR